MKAIAFILGMIMIPALQALGQVAAPGLLPFANPATLSWELSPFISSTILRIDQFATRNAGTAADREGSGSGVMLRGRSPGETIGHGLHYLDARLELGNSSVGKVNQGVRSMAFGFSISPGEQIALGVGAESMEEYEDTTVGSRTVGTLTPLVGASLRLAGWFFLGTVHGQRTLKSNVPEKDGQTRNMSRYAVGGRWLWQTGLIHLEYLHQDSPPFREIAYPGSPFTSDEMDTEVDTFIAEAVVYGVVVGYSATVSETLGDLLKNETTRTQINLVGFMMPENFSSTLVNRVEETENRRTNTNERREIKALVVAWRF